jgi:hypothetical protein
MKRKSKDDFSFKVVFASFMKWHVANLPPFDPEVVPSD